MDAPKKKPRFPQRGGFWCVMLAIYSFTGGVAKYVQLLVEDHAFTVDAMIDSIISHDSVLVNEGRAILVE